jgi:hydrogenase maturation protein HypF
LPFVNGIFKWQPFLSEMLKDYSKKEDVSTIAWKVFNSLAAAIADAAGKFHVGKIACSGGVFQNALLTDMVSEKLQSTSQLYLHCQLSPNDECISFGQLAYYFIETQSEEKARSQTRNVIVTS